MALRNLGFSLCKMKNVEINDSQAFFNLCSLPCNSDSDLFYVFNFFHLLLLVGRLISLQLISIFLNYESMITHLQEAWKIQNKVTYSSTIYYNYVLSG